MSLTPWLHNDRCPAVRRGRRHPHSIWDEMMEPLSLMDEAMGTLMRPSRNGNNWPIANGQIQMSSAPETHIENGPNKFKMFLDVRNYKPEEIEVTMGGNNRVTIHGKHEERQDDHGFIAREFTRSYLLPEDVKSEEIQSNWSRDGCLSIEVPKKLTGQEGLPASQRIPIKFENAKK